MHCALLSTALGYRLFRQNYVVPDGRHPALEYRVKPAGCQRQVLSSMKGCALLRYVTERTFIELETVIYP